MSIDELISGHRNFKARFNEHQQEYRILAEQGQDPDILWIGCSDSRVIPERITGTTAGKLFTIRNVANIVPPAEWQGASVGAAVEYAVLHLLVTDIIVCGHTECGGIGALFGNIDSHQEPHIAQWVAQARSAFDQVQASDIPEEEQYFATIKANVLLQLNNLRTYQCVQKAIESKGLTLHGWLYDLHTGDIQVHNHQDEDWSPLD